MHTTHLKPERVLNMAGKVAIVSGAGAAGDGIGIGRACAITLAQRGAKVCLIDINLQDAQRTGRMIDEAGGESMSIQADVGQTDSCRGIVDNVVEHWGRIDALVNNVGVRGPKGTAVDVDVAAWTSALHTNVTSMMLMARFCIPVMAATAGSAIVNISSAAGLRGGHPNLLYPTTKAAIVGMTKSMAFHHGKAGIRVNCVCPGMVHTPLVFGAGIAEERREARRDASMLKTEGNAWDIANAVLYLCCDESRWVTGAVFPIDAGLTAITSFY